MKSCSDRGGLLYFTSLYDGLNALKIIFIRASIIKLLGMKLKEGFSICGQFTSQNNLHFVLILILFNTCVHKQKVNATIQTSVTSSIVIQTTQIYVRCKAIVPGFATHINLCSLNQNCWFYRVLNQGVVFLYVKTIIEYYQNVNYSDHRESCKLSAYWKPFFKFHPQ